MILGCGQYTKRRQITPDLAYRRGLACGDRFSGTFITQSARKYLIIYNTEAMLRKILGCAMDTKPLPEEPIFKRFGTDYFILPGQAINEITQEAWVHKPRHCRDKGAYRVRGIATRTTTDTGEAAYKLGLSIQKATPPQDGLSRLKKAVIEAFDMRTVFDPSKVSWGDPIPVRYYGEKSSHSLFSFRAAIRFLNETERLLMLKANQIDPKILHKNLYSKRPGDHFDVVLEAARQQGVIEATHIGDTRPLQIEAVIQSVFLSQPTKPPGGLLSLIRG
jgi:hypothetical protein